MGERRDKVAAFQSTNPLRLYPNNPLANPNTSVSNADATDAAGEGRARLRRGKRRRKIGPKSAAPPMPASWQEVATSVATGNMKL